MLTIKEVIKTFYNALLQRLKKHRGNWEQNDPTADDYIKNRPFYTDDSKKEVVVKTKTFTAENSYWWGSPFAFIPVVGETYKVTFDGKEYICPCYLFYDAPTIGNISLDGVSGQDAGEPFYYFWYDSYEYGLCVRDHGKHTITIEKIDVTKIDERYLPGNLVRQESIDELYDYTNYLSNEIWNKVSYTQSQNLSTSQKQTARANIGAVAASDLATVANSGDYNDLENKPCSKIFIDSPWMAFNWSSSTSISPAGNSFNTLYSSSHVIKYKNPIAWGLFMPSEQGGEAYLESDYMLGIKIGDRYYWGNLSLYDSRYTDTGETWCIYAEYAYSTPCYAYVFYSEQSSNAYVVQYSYRETTVQQLSEELIPDTIARASELADVATSGSYNDLNDKPCSASIENVTWLFSGNNSYSSVKQQVTIDDGTKVYYTLYGVIKYTGDYVFLPDSLKKINIQTVDYEIASMHEVQISGAKIYYTGNSSYLKAFAEYNYNRFPEIYGEFKDLQFSIGDGNFAFMAYYLPAKGYWDCVVLSKNGTNSGSALHDQCAFQFGLYQTLDEKLIPDTIARAEDIPSVEGLATEEYVDTKISDLVNAAPEALDTLKELSSALGDDPNFATTVLTQLGNKADVASLEGLATESYVDHQISTLGGRPILNDSVTGTNYMLYVENGKLTMQETDVLGGIAIFKDVATGASYELYVENGTLSMKEAE